MSARTPTLYIREMDGSMEPDEDGTWATADDLRAALKQAANLESTIRAAFKAYEQGDMERCRAMLFGTLLELECR